MRQFLKYKKGNIIFVILVALVSIISSCEILAPPKINPNIILLDERNYELLNGSFKIFSTDTAHRTLEHLFFNKKCIYNRQSMPDSSVQFVVEFIDKENLKGTLLRNDSVITSAIKKGKLINGYFVTNNILVESYNFFLRGLGSQSSRFGLLKNGNITVDTYDGTVVYFLVIPLGAADGARYGVEFKRNNN